MQRFWMINLFAFRFHLKVFFQSLQELLVAHTIEIFYHAVVIHDMQLVIRETNG